jgi:hypothetical protein
MKMKTQEFTNMQILQITPVTTTDATITTAYTRAVSSSTQFSLSGRVEGRKSDRTASITVEFQAVFRRAAAGALVLVGATITPLEDSSGTPAVNITTSSNNAIITVQGIVAETWNWKFQDIILTRF